MFLSIIVPVYNVEAYLERCVGSLVGQDIDRTDCEIILVDDGSTDGSGALCDRIASQEPGIRVIHKENGGLGSARNAGIRAAAGEYILFVDSDDYLEPRVLGGLRGQIERQGLDILRFNYQNVNEDGEVFEPNKVSKPFVDYSDEVCDGETFLTERLGYACYACQFIIRSTLLKKGDGLFKEGIWFEDVDWTPRVLLQAQRVASTPTVVYDYLFRTGSITRTPDPGKQKKKMEDRISIIDTLQALSRQTGNPAWFRGMASQIAISILTVAGLDFYPERRQIIRALRQKGVFPLSAFHATAGAARKMKIANFSPELLCRMLHLKKH